jgi:hypothetical protein
MAGRSTPPDPNYKLYGQYGGKAKYEAAKKERDDAKIKAKGLAGNTAEYYYKANKVLDNDLNGPNGWYDLLNQAKEENNTVNIAKFTAEINKTKAKISSNYLLAKVYEGQIKDAQTKFEKAKVKYKNSDSGNKKDKTEDAYDGIWKFNAPMINNLGALENGSLPNMLSAGPAATGDAKTFWSVNSNGLYSYNIGGKGTFQMDRQINTAAFKADSKKAADAIKRPFDPNYYGFKFHYNPTTLNMSWAGVMGANPVFEAANLDPAVPMSQNLFASTINFVVILNRIQDLAELTAAGSYKNGKNPYSIEVSPEDRLDIVQKGTMYDLEYLFRAMHGFAGSANYDSTLMGKTKDPGWLPVRPVELHLGQKLRYRVRVLNMEVSHKMFSTSMVPIFSEVSFSCMRYWDGPIGKDAKK